MAASVGNCCERRLSQLGGRKVQPLPAMRTPLYQPAFHTAMSSDLALLAPLSLAKRYDVAIRDLPFDTPSLDLLLFWRRDSAQEPALRWLREEILASVKS